MAGGGVGGEFIVTLGAVIALLVWLPGAATLALSLQNERGAQSPASLSMAW